MPWYKCTIEGENFPGVLRQTDEALGFVAIRAVWAENAQEAEFNAVLLLRADPDFVLPEGHPSAAQARVMFESVEEIEREQAEAIVNEGARWYPMNASGSGA